MTRLDRALSQTLKEVRREHDASCGGGLIGARADALRRIRARRRSTAVGAAVVTAGVAWGGFTASDRLDSVPETTAPAQGPGREGTRLGFWPTLTERGARELCESMDLREPEAVGGTFVGEALGRTNVAVYDRDGDGRRKTTAFVHRGRAFGAAGIVEPLPGADIPQHPGVNVETTRLGSACWWVTAVTSRGTDAVDASVDGDTLRVSFDLSGAAVSADVIVVEEGSGTRRYLEGEPGQSRIDVDGFRGPGHVLVLWRSRDGWVVTAEGVAVPRA